MRCTFVLAQAQPLTADAPCVMNQCLERHFRITPLTGDALFGTVECTSRHLATTPLAHDPLLTTTTPCLYRHAWIASLARDASF